MLANINIIMPTVFVNTNECYSFNQSITTVLVGLSAQRCSEVIIINKTGQSIFIYDQYRYSDEHRLLLSDNESIALRGITNTSEVSAKTATGSGSIYYRTQYYSSSLQR
jgi:hypothetical protein